MVFSRDVEHIRVDTFAAQMVAVGVGLAMELGTFGIRVNAICPGSVAGERIERVIRDEAASRSVSPDDVRTSFQRQVSMRTFVDAADITGMILFLCSNQGARISGQALAIDGHTESLAQDRSIS